MNYSVENENELQNLIDEIKLRQETYGDDKITYMLKAQLFDVIGEYNQSYAELKKAYELDRNDYEILYSLGAELEKIGDFALASVYFGQAARLMKEQGNIQECDNLIREFEQTSNDRNLIFDTVLKCQKKTFVFLSICGFGTAKQRYQNLAVALAQVGNDVIYVSPEAGVKTNVKASEKELANLAFTNMKLTEGIKVITPYVDIEHGVRSYDTIVETIASKNKDAVFIVSNINAYDVLCKIKGKNIIIFDCADDNSDYKNAFWSSEETYKKEIKLVDLADEITCTAASLFLKKSVIDKKNNVHLSQNAVCAQELKYGQEVEEPVDLKDITHPRIGYVGVIYRRFDRELFYELAKNNPDKSFVIVGSIMDEYVKPIYKNIYILGPKNHSDLASYYRNMDICIIPYYDNAKMSMSCDPVKIHEHISCGVPTIVTYMPDTAVDRPLVYHGNTAKEFQCHIDTILKEKPEIDKKIVDEYLARHSWIARACHLMRISNKNININENKTNTIKYLSENYKKIKDVHKNFGIIYAMTVWDSDYELCKKIINKYRNELDSEFIQEMIQKFDDRSIFKEHNGKVSDVKNVSLIDSKNCASCMSCEQTCSQHAITMTKNDLGFSYPIVDEEKCNNCGKCLNNCPANEPIILGNNNDQCYAIMGSNDVRINSSSGGVFPIIAQKIIDNGGYVAGAVFDKEYNVKHIVSNKIWDVKKMYSSKYAESDLNDVYRQIKSLLDEDKMVLFSGCPCQTAGLNAFLGKKYEKLVSVSVVCAGVPSAKVFKEYIANLSNNKKIKEISFRNKRKFGWGTGLFIRYEDGTEYVADSQNDVYMRGFLSGLYLKDACYECDFKNDMYSDIVLGDYWGINSILKFDDGLGTSYVSVNSEKGKKLISSCMFDYKKVDRQIKEQAVVFNPKIRHSMKIPIYRDKFIENYKDSNIVEAFDKTFTEKCYDAVLVLWWSNNYGNALTNYALYTKLKELGYNILVLDSFGVKPMYQFKNFAEKYYELSSNNYLINERKYILNSSNNFVVGSDQVWNKTFSMVLRDNGYFQLKFVSDDKNKISYGSSFGQTSDAIEESKLDYYKELYNRFDAVSTREKFGVDIMKNRFNINAEYVVDPVFLLNKNQYMELANNSNIKKDRKFIVSYILTPTEEKKVFLEKLKEELGDVDIVNIIDAEPVRIKENVSKFNIGDVKISLSPEEWVYYFANSEFVITDSYHGTCFSMIFEKPFYSFVNRESERFETFKEFDELKDNIIDNNSIIYPDKIIKKLDYTNINKKIVEMREKSIKYIQDNIRK